jgi:hypothetical protein
VLRIIDLAAHYRADKKKIAAFATRAANQRQVLAEQAASARAYAVPGFSYIRQRLKFDGERFLAEAMGLFELAKHVTGKSGGAPGQTSLLSNL